MKTKTRFAWLLMLLTFFAIFVVAYAAENEDELIPYKLIATIAVPSGLAFPGGGFDISWVDSEAGRYYLADRGNPTSTPKVPPGIDVIDSRHDKFLYEIPLSTTANGVVAI